MNKVVQNILNSYHTKEAQLKELSKLAKDIEFAKGVVDGTYKYCKECDDAGKCEEKASGCRTAIKRPCRVCGNFTTESN